MFGLRTYITALLGLLLICLMANSLIGQVESIQIVQTCDSDYKFQDTLVSKDQFENYQVHLNKIIQELVEDDYLEASIDSMQFNSNRTGLKAFLHVGARYSFDKLVLDSLGAELLKSLELSVPQSTAEYLHIRNQLADYYADRGYPFAQISLSEMNITDGEVTGNLEVESGRQIIIDSILLEGNVIIRQGYLNNYLDIYRGDPYNHKSVKAIKRKLDKLAFLETKEDPYLSFVTDYTTIHLPVKAKNTSRFDLLFGVIPTNAIEGRQLFLSVDITAEALNKLNYGEYIYFNFQRLRPEQQQLEFKFNYPYLLDTPFAINAEFGIFRNSTDYQTVLADLGVQYLINSTNYIKVAYNFESSKLIDVDTAAVLSTQRLPDDLSVSQSGIGLEAYFSTLDYKFNPRRGMSLKAGAVLGQKQILIDPIITSLQSNSVDFSTAYDSLQLKSNRYELTLDFSYFQPVAKRGTFGAQLRGGWRFSGAGIFRNERFQIGGHKLLRGFDEGSIFTPYFGVLTIDYRLLLSDNSYLSFPFVDIGYIEKLGEEASFAYGVGGSLAFETKVGLFNFSIAAGRDENTGFDFARPKAHFGFVSLF